MEHEIFIEQIWQVCDKNLVMDVIQWKRSLMLADLMISHKPFKFKNFKQNLYFL